MKKPSLSIRALSTALCVIFLATNCLFAHKPESNIWEERRKNIQLAQLPVNINPFSSMDFKKLPAPAASPFRLPSHIKAPASPQIQSILSALTSQYGTIRKIQTPSGSKSDHVVIHIQDIHMNQEAQKNIGAVVQALISKGQVDLLALEGAFGPIDLKDFHDFPDHAAVQKVADDFLRDNRISGPIHAALSFTSKNLSTLHRRPGDLLAGAQVLPRIIGIDDRVHYDANVAAYLRSRKEIGSIKRSLDEENQSIYKKKGNIFNSSLQAYDAMVESYRENRLTLGDYASQMTAMSKEPSGTLSLFNEALKLEKTLDFARVESERGLLLSALVKKLSKTQTANLLELSASYRLSQISHVNFYDHLKQMCDSSGVSLNKFPEMARYLQYILLSDQIDAEKLFEELKVLESKTYATLAKTQEEKELVEKSRELFLKKKLVDFALTKEEWGEYIVSSPRQSFGRGPGFHSVQHLDPGQKIAGTTILDPFESFYREAETRDEKMATNFLTQLHTNKFEATTLKGPVPFPVRGEARRGVSVLVTGGFHSTGIDQQLVAAGATVITFVPKISKIEDENGSAYLSVFAQEKTPLEKMFEGEKLFLPKEVFSPADDLRIRLILSNSQESLKKLLKSTHVHVVRAFIFSGTKTFMLVRNLKQLTIVFISHSGKMFQYTLMTPFGFFQKLKSRMSRFKPSFHDILRPFEIEFHPYWITVQIPNPFPIRLLAFSEGESATNNQKTLNIQIPIPQLIFMTGKSNDSRREDPYSLPAPRFLDSSLDWVRAYSVLHPENRKLNLFINEYPRKFRYGVDERSGRYAEVPIGVLVGLRSDGKDSLLASPDYFTCAPLILKTLDQNNQPWLWHGHLFTVSPNQGGIRVGGVFHQIQEILFLLNKTGHYPTAMSISVELGKSGLPVRLDPNPDHETPHAAPRSRLEFVSQNLRMNISQVIEHLGWDLPPLGIEIRDPFSRPGFSAVVTEHTIYFRKNRFHGNPFLLKEISWDEIVDHKEGYRFFLTEELHEAARIRSGLVNEEFSIELIDKLLGSHVDSVKENHVRKQTFLGMENPGKKDSGPSGAAGLTRWFVGDNLFLIGLVETIVGAIITMVLLIIGISTGTIHAPPSLASFSEMFSYLNSLVQVSLFLPFNISIPIPIILFFIVFLIHYISGVVVRKPDGEVRMLPFNLWWSFVGTLIFWGFAVSPVLLALPGVMLGSMMFSVAGFIIGLVVFGFGHGWVNSPQEAREFIVRIYRHMSRFDPSTPSNSSIEAVQVEWEDLTRLPKWTMDNWQRAQIIQLTLEMNGEANDEHRKILEVRLKDLFITDDLPSWELDESKIFEQIKQWESRKRGGNLKDQGDLEIIWESSPPAEKSGTTFFKLVSSKGRLIFMIGAFHNNPYSIQASFVVAQLMHQYPQKFVAFIEEMVGEANLDYVPYIPDMWVLHNAREVKAIPFQAAYNLISLDVIVALSGGNKSIEGRLLTSAVLALVMEFSLRGDKLLVGTGAYFLEAVNRLARDMKKHPSEVIVKVATYIGENWNHDDLLRIWKEHLKVMDALVQKSNGMELPLLHQFLESNPNRTFVAWYTGAKHTGYSNSRPFESVHRPGAEQMFRKHGLMELITGITNHLNTVDPTAMGGVGNNTNLQSGSTSARTGRTNPGQTGAAGLTLWLVGKNLFRIGLVETIIGAITTMVLLIIGISTGTIHAPPSLAFFSEMLSYLNTLTYTSFSLPFNISIPIPITLFFIVFLIHYVSGVVVRNPDGGIKTLPFNLWRSFVGTLIFWGFALAAFSPAVPGLLMGSPELSLFGFAIGLAIFSFGHGWVNSQFDPISFSAFVQNASLLALIGVTFYFTNSLFLTIVSTFYGWYLFHFFQSIGGKSDGKPWLKFSLSDYFIWITSTVLAFYSLQPLFWMIFDPILGSVNFETPLWWGLADLIFSCITGFIAVEIFNQAVLTFKRILSAEHKRFARPVALIVVALFGWGGSVLLTPWRSLGVVHEVVDQTLGLNIFAEGKIPTSYAKTFLIRGVRVFLRYGPQVRNFNEPDGKNEAFHLRNILEIYGPQLNPNFDTINVSATDNPFQFMEIHRPGSFLHRRDLYLTSGLWDMRRNIVGQMGKSAWGRASLENTQLWSQWEGNLFSKDTQNGYQKAFHEAFYLVQSWNNFHKNMDWWGLPPNLRWHVLLQLARDRKGELISIKDEEMEFFIPIGFEGRSVLWVRMFENPMSLSTDIIKAYELMEKYREDVRKNPIMRLYQLDLYIKQVRYQTGQYESPLWPSEKKWSRAEISLRFDALIQMLEKGGDGIPNEVDSSTLEMIQDEVNMVEEVLKKLPKKYNFDQFSDGIKDNSIPHKSNDRGMAFALAMMLDVVLKPHLGEWGWLIDSVLAIAAGALILLPAMKTFIRRGVEGLVHQKIPLVTRRGLGSVIHGNLPNPVNNGLMNQMINLSNQKSTDEHLSGAQQKSAQLLYQVATLIRDQGMSAQAALDSAGLGSHENIVLLDQYDQPTLQKLNWFASLGQEEGNERKQSIVIARAKGLYSQLLKDQDEYSFLMFVDGAEYHQLNEEHIQGVQLEAFLLDQPWAVKNIYENYQQAVLIYPSGTTYSEGVGLKKGSPLTGSESRALILDQLLKFLPLLKKQLDPVWWHKVWRAIAEAA